MTEKNSEIGLRPLPDMVTPQALMNTLSSNITCSEGDETGTVKLIAETTTGKVLVVCEHMKDCKSLCTTLLKIVDISDGNMRIGSPTDKCKADVGLDAVEFLAGHIDGERLRDAYSSEGRL